MDKVFGCTVLDEIKATEEAIKACFAKVDELEEKIKRNEITEEYKKIAKQELMEVKKLLATNTKQLKEMHKHGGRSYGIAAAIIFLGFLIYGVYAMYHLKMDSMMFGFGDDSTNFHALEEQIVDLN
ncbi:uncharacterized protein LOC123296269 [Chrysoperla carnea]|uniref:uncharacterized protein LOC123296269 n=1 Tax=Chrysoperla carnea TaxID=189513 RepID=UPI001D07A943|nr:uncharacterized protein LOC123296269 [Chrysoperla carnea]